MFLALFVLWIIFNGNFTLEIALFGLAIAAFVYFFACKCLDYSFKKDVLLVKRIGYFLEYMGVLIVEIIKANVATIKLVVSSRYDIDPVLVTFDVHFESEIARVLFANSITLTPGTITADVTGDTFTVHALDESFIDGIDKGRIVDILHRMEEVNG